jgi:hypothetical protein
MVFLQLKCKSRKAIIFDAEIITADLKPSIGSLEITNWIENNEDLLSGLQGQSSHPS